MNARDAWAAALGQLQVQLNRSTYDTWLRHVELLGYEDGRFVVTVPNAYTKDWIERHLQASLNQTLTRIFRKPADIQLLVWNPVDEKDDAGGPLLEFDVHAAESSAPTGTPLHGLNPAYTFDQYVIGDSNRYAALLGKAIVESAVGQYSPVLFYGGMGLGKTHLMQAIAQQMSQTGHQVVYLTAEEYTTELVNAIRTHETIKFRERFRRADVVLIDDLQFVEGKEATQNELVALWDAMRNRRRTIIFAADRLPRDMTKLSQDARSRFQAGPMAEITAPDVTLRRELVARKGIDRGVLLTPEVIDLLASRITSTVRDIESAVEQLQTYARLTQQAVTLDSARTVLVALGSSVPAQVPVEITVTQVMAATAQYFRFSSADLASRGRTKAVVHARQVAMYLAREETHESLVQIGAAFGGRDHTTVLHSCQKVAEAIATGALKDTLIRDLQSIREYLRRQVLAADTTREQVIAGR